MEGEEGGGHRALPVRGVSVLILLQTPNPARVSPHSSHPTSPVLCEHPNPAPNPIPGSGITPFLDPTLPVHGVSILILLQTPSLARVSPHSLIPHPLSYVNTPVLLQTPSPVQRNKRAEPLEGDLGSIFQEEEREEPWTGVRRRSRAWP